MTYNGKRSADNNSPLDELRHRLAEPGPLRQPFDRAQDKAQGKLWAQRFRRLAEAIAEAPMRRQGSEQALRQDSAQGLSCQECEELLDLYVDEELQGRDPSTGSGQAPSTGSGRAVQQMYPLVWQHLRTCSRCRQAHDLLADTLSLERRGELPVSPHRIAPRLPFLQPQSPDTAWTTRLRSRIDGAPFGLSLTFNLSYLQSLLSGRGISRPSPLSPLPARADKPVAPSATLLLLSDLIPMGDQTLAVEVTADRDIETPDRLRLRAAIASSTSLPQGLCATLNWAGQTRSGAIDARGQIDFGEVSLTALQDALESGEGSFEIVFQAQEIEDDATNRID